MSDWKENSNISGFGKYCGTKKVRNFKLSCYNNCHEEEFFNEKDF